MPRILADTVAEHRSRQMQAVLEAARLVFMEHGYAGFKVGLVADRTGLARSSLYEYFQSKDDLLVAVCQMGIDDAVRMLERAMAAAATPRQRIEVFVRAQLELISRSEHSLASVLSDTRISSGARASVMEVHSKLLGPLVRELTALGVESPRLVASLIEGMVDAATIRIESGDSPDEVRTVAEHLCLACLGLAQPTD